jgi:hypothetical protein
MLQGGVDGKIIYIWKKLTKNFISKHFTIKKNDHVIPTSKIN